MRALLVAVAVAGAVLAAGCSSSEPEPQSPPIKPTTVAAKTAPVSAFTEVVAEYRPQLEKAAADGRATCLETDRSKDCQDAYRLFSNVAAKLHGDLLAVHGAGMDTYQGAPPKEIASLLSETETLASRATRMADTYQAASCPDIVLDCSKEKLYAQAAAEELVHKLSAWDAHM